MWKIYVRLYNSANPSITSNPHKSTKKQGNDESSIGIMDKSQATNDKSKDVKNKPTEEEKKPLLIEDKTFRSQVSNAFLVYFEQQQLPTKKIHPFMPFISLMRSILISAVVFGGVTGPLTQVYTVMVVEVGYTVMIVMYNNKSERSEKIIEGYNSMSNSVYLMLKVITIYDIDDDSRQLTYGTVMTVVLMGSMIVNICYIVYSVCMVVIDVGKYIVKKCRESDEEKKKNRCDSVWYETSVYEYTESSVPMPPTKNMRVLSVGRFQRSGVSWFNKAERRVAQGLTVQNIREEAVRARKRIEDNIDLF